MKFWAILLCLSCLSVRTSALEFVDFKDFHHAVSDLHGLKVLRQEKHITGIRSILEQVNREVNAIDFVPNGAVYGKAQYWPTEVEFINFGGMCRDYAVEKYRLLRRAGVPDANMAILVGILRETGEVHAVLTVKTEDGVYVLENPQHGEKARPVQDERRLAAIDAIYAINRVGVNDLRETANKGDTSR